VALGLEQRPPGDTQIPAELARLEVTEPLRRIRCHGSRRPENLISEGEIAVSRAFGHGPFNGILQLTGEPPYLKILQPSCRRHGWPVAGNDPRENGANDQGRLSLIERIASSAPRQVRSV
jgi:hypothetical protein